MRQIRINSLGLLLVAVLFGSVGAFAQPLYVQSDQAAVFDGPGFDRETLGRLPRGAEVRTLESREDWHRVEAESVSGWMPALLLREEPPTRTNSSLNAAADLDAGARRRASAVTTAGAVRGVDEDERLLDDPDLDVEALREMESMGVAPEEAMAFMAEDENES
jgi:hypothetical protein